MFWKKFSSDEYLELKKEIGNLKIELENVKLTFDLVKKKLRVKAKLDEEEPEQTEKLADNPFLDPTGKPLSNSKPH